MYLAFHIFNLTGVNMFNKAKKNCSLPSLHYKMNTNLVTIDITDELSLLQAFDILHDARCDLSTIQMDRTRGVWKARFEREFFEDQKLMTHKRKFFLFTKTTFPLADAELTLRDVKFYQIEDNAKIEIFTFNECQIKKNIATLYFCENMKMTLAFNDKPKGKLVDLRLLNKTGSMYKIGFKNLRK